MTTNVKLNRQRGASFGQAASGRARWNRLPAQLPPCPGSALIAAAFASVVSAEAGGKLLSGDGEPHI